MSRLTLDGELSFTSVAERLRNLPRQAYQEVDLSRVTRMDSSGAALLLELARRGNTKLRVIGASAQTLQLLRFLDLDHVFELAPAATSAAIPVPTS